LNFLCSINEENFIKIKIGELFKFSGVVKAKSEDLIHYENTYEKIIEIYQIESKKGILKKINSSVSNLNNQNFQLNNKTIKKKNYSLQNIQNSKKSFEVNNYKKIKINIPQNVISSNFFFSKYYITPNDLLKFHKLSEYKCLSSFIILNIIDNKFYSNFDFINILLFFYSFSKGTELTINIFDLTQTENISNQLKKTYNFISNLDSNYFNFNNGNKSNEDFLFIKDSKNSNNNNCKNEMGNFEINFGKIFHKKCDFILLDQIPININNGIHYFINYAKILKEFSSKVNLSTAENSIIHSMNFSGLGSLIVNTKIHNVTIKSNELLNSNLMQLVNFFDVNLFYMDRLDSEKERKKTNQVLKDQFEYLDNQIKGNSNNNVYIKNSESSNSSNKFTFNKKRKFYNYFTEKNQYDITSINSYVTKDKNFESYYGYYINSSEDIIGLVDLNYFSFLKEKIKKDLNIIEKDEFLSSLLNMNYDENLYKEYLNKNKFDNNILKNNLNNKNPDYASDSKSKEEEISGKIFFFKLLIFINNFINPKFDIEINKEISYLAKSLEEIFYPLKNCEFFEFPNIENLIIKFSFIKARIDMREKIIINDIFEGFLFVKEYLSMCLTFSLANRKDMVNKNKKTKINFVMEKIKQFCQTEKKKNFTKNELKLFCDEINMIDEYDKIVETLNFNGFIIKINANEYQLS